MSWKFIGLKRSKIGEIITDYWTAPHRAQNAIRKTVRLTVAHSSDTESQSLAVIRRWQKYPS